jgi:hypothetical protein
MRPDNAAAKTRKKPRRVSTLRVFAVCCCTLVVFSLVGGGWLFTVMRPDRGDDNDLVDTVIIGSGLGACCLANDTCVDALYLHECQRRYDDSVAFHRDRLCVDACPSMSAAPSLAPTLFPTFAPTLTPTRTPTAMPSLQPTQTPTAQPTVSPTRQPTPAPSQQPTATPTTTQPTPAPSQQPTLQPTLQPSNAPTLTPTLAPSMPPSPAPTSAPTNSAQCAALGCEPPVDGSYGHGANFTGCLATVCNVTSNRCVLRSLQSCASDAACGLGGGCLGGSCYYPFYGMPITCDSGCPCACGYETVAPVAYTERAYLPCLAPPTPAPTTVAPSSAPSRAPTPAPTAPPDQCSAFGCEPPVAGTEGHDANFTGCVTTVCNTTSNQCVLRSSITCTVNFDCGPGGRCSAGICYFSYLFNMPVACGVNNTCPCGCGYDDVVPQDFGQRAVLPCVIPPSPAPTRAPTPAPTLPNARTACTGVPFNIPPHTGSPTTVQTANFLNVPFVSSLNVVADVVLRFIGWADPYNVGTTPRLLTLELRSPVMGVTTQLTPFALDGTPPATTVNLTWTDSSLTVIPSSGGPLTTGSYRPSPGTMSAFYGINDSGVWTLFLSDVEQGGFSNGSSLLQWCLDFTYVHPTSSPTASPTRSPTPSPTSNGGACWTLECGQCDDDTDASTCASNQGIFKGAGTTCGTTTCQTGACCLGTVCNQITSVTCATLEGSYNGDGSSCFSNPCIIFSKK